MKKILIRENLKKHDECFLVTFRSCIDDYKKIWRVVMDRKEMESCKRGGYCIKVENFTLE